MKLGDIRIVLEEDREAAADLFGGDGSKFSDAAALVEETRKRVRDGDWEMYQITIERAVPGGWEDANHISRRVHPAGWLGTFADAEGIGDDGLRQQVVELINGVGLFNPVAHLSELNLVVQRWTDGATYTELYIGEHGVGDHEYVQHTLDPGSAFDDGRPDHDWAMVQLEDLEDLPAAVREAIRRNTAEFHTCTPDCATKENG
ncbi:hypothetical protein [Kitasatospora sp. NPDC098663]|uniref:hypothetical protein n=1 Tax=Kitasatospora sp. NPDC098663 TaxID=3364096 RepID=UPI0038168F30